VTKAYSADQIRAAEAPHLAQGEPLMARAAAGLAAVIREFEPTRMLVLVGAGNNGADALWAAAEIASSGVNVALLPTTDHPNPDALAAALAAGAHLERPDAAAAIAGSSDLIVDGILGIGANASPALRGLARQVVADLLDTPIRVIAVDIPSGIDPDDGSVPDPTVLAADVTVTFGGYKAGLAIEPARSYAGEVRLVDVGIADELAAMTPMLGGQI
jgi:NAD(P)H-hydrate epimerase